MIADILRMPEVKKVDWVKVLGNGVLFEPHIGRTRMSHHLKYSTLGVQVMAENQKTQARTSKDMDDIFDLGMQHLLPREARKIFNRIEDRVAYVRDTYCIKVAMGYFVPVNAFQEFYKVMTALRDKYFAERDRIFKDYDVLRNQGARKHVHAAFNAFLMRLKTDPESIPEEERRNPRIFLARERQRVMALYPPKQEVLDSFYFTIGLTHIDLSAFSRSLEEAESAEAEVIEGVSAGELMELTWQQEKTEQLRQMMTEMNRSVVEEARKSKKQKVDELEDFLTASISQVRGVVYEACVNCLSALTKDGKLEPRKIVQLKGVLDAIRQFNFYQDADAERAKDLIGDLLAGYAGKEEKQRTVSKQEIEQTLRRIAVVMRSTLIPLQYEFREEREESRLAEETRLALARIPLSPDARQEREAREALGMSMPAWLGSEREAREEIRLLETSPALALASVADERSERPAW